jgi:multidrug efflux pump subunit AcrB
VIAQFDLEVEPDKASNDINEHIATILRDLPPGTRPEVKKADPDAAPVIVLSVKGPPDQSIRDLTRFADKQVKQRIERLSGVGQVVILGGQDRQINVHLDAIRLAATGVSALEVQRAISTGNVNVPGGQIEMGPTITSCASRAARSIRRRSAIVVRQLGDHVDLVATSRTSRTRGGCRTPARRATASAIALSVRKQSGTNTGRGRRPRHARGRRSCRRRCPASYSVDVVRDNSLQIRTSASQVLEHLVIGALLAALVVLLFLGSLRSDDRSPRSRSRCRSSRRSA